MTIPLRLLLQTAQVRLYEGEGAYGPVHAGPVEVPCRIEYGSQLVRNAAGDEVVSTASIYFPPEPRIIPESTVSVDGMDRVVIEVVLVYDATSPHHQLVRL